MRNLRNNERKNDAAHIFWADIHYSSHLKKKASVHKQLEDIFKGEAIEKILKDTFSHLFFSLV